jgi:hypothetical protein
MLNIAFPVIIQYDYYCSFGELELEVKVTPKSLVWACTDPKYSSQHGVETSLIPINIQVNGIETDVEGIIL